MSTLLKKVRKRGVALFCAICVSASLWATAGLANGTQTDSAIAPYLDRMADAVTEFTLDNGMTFIMQAQHQSPTVSTVIYADVGFADEAPGQREISHYLEHLLFMGTSEIGTTNYEAEKAVLNQLDETFDQLKAAEVSGNEKAVAELRLRFEQLQLEADAYVIPEHFSQIVEQAGGINLNAATSQDATWYFYDLPANKLELWFSLESDRFANPVFRRFYEEKQVVQEEEIGYFNDPVRQLFSGFSEVAYDADHPYHQPVPEEGIHEDLYQLTRDQVEDFYQTYYDPSNLTAVLVGDVDPQQVQQWAQIYFSRLQTQGTPPELEAQIPNQTASRSYSIPMDTQPVYLEGYHRPGLNSLDHTLHQAVCSLLSEGRTSRLHRALIDTQLATSVDCYTDSPLKVSSLTELMVHPFPNKTDEVASIIGAELARLKETPIENEELEALKARLRSGVLKSLSSKEELAYLLATYEAITGDWHNAFRNIEDIETMAAADIQQAVREVFTPENRTVGTIVPVEDS